MKKFSKIITTIVAAVLVVTAVVAPAFVTNPVFAANEGETCSCEDGSSGHLIPGAIIKDACDCGHGEAVIHILNIVVNILTVGVSILAIIGITIVGTQYLTAGDNEERTRKAKRRLFEIVIGIVAYVIIYALLVWLLPGFEGIKIGG